MECLIDVDRFRNGRPIFAGDGSKMLRYDRSMNRYAWIVLSLAALVGLRAPLCTFACTEAASATVATAEDHTGDDAPCHGGPSGVPEDSPSTDRHCDCDQLPVVLTAGDTTKAGVVLNAASVPAVAVATIEVPSLAGDRSSLRSHHRRLPPPDLLLLKSTLLI
jgi:hypothetical protein